MTVRILTGHVLDMLATLPEKSVHCAITSPPYYGLRSYSTEPQVWAITADQRACGHEWGEAAEPPTPKRGNKPGDFSTSSLTNPWRQDGVSRRVVSSLCRKCGCFYGELGQEPTLALFLEHLIAVFAAVRRVLRDDGLLFVNIGDSYCAGGNGARDPERWPKQSRNNNGDRLIHGKKHPGNGLKPKDRMLVPHRFAIAMQEDGWYVRSDIIWAKTAPMPESVTDRPTTSHEHVFMFAKKSTYYCDMDAVREITGREMSWEEYEKRTAPGATWQSGGIMRYAGANKHDGGHSHPLGRNLRDVWLLGPSPFSDWTTTVRQVPVSWDEADDDTTRIPSPDCPMHASWDLLHSTPADGVRVGDDPTRTARTDGRCAQAPVFGSVPIAPRRAPNSPGGSSDSLPLLCDPAATPRSNGTSRMDPAPATTLPCTLSDEMSGRTGGMSTQPESDAPRLDMPESNTSPDGSDARSPGQTNDRTPDTSSLDCSCQYIKSVAESVSHFAVFPPEIPRRAILMGSSEKGACPECGAAWRRVVEKGPSHYAMLGKNGRDVISRNDSVPDAGKGGKGGGGNTRTENGTVPSYVAAPSSTVGWSPACRCADEHGQPLPPVPCQVLDPFLGAGTTALVADRLGRDCIGIDLNTSYAEMSLNRIKGDAPMFADVAVEPPPERARQSSLFGADGEGRG